MSRWIIILLFFSSTLIMLVLIVTPTLAATITSTFHPCRGSFTNTSEHIIGKNYLSTPVFGGGQDSLALSDDGKILAYAGPADASYKGATWIYNTISQTESVLRGSN